MSKNLLSGRLNVGSYEAEKQFLSAIFRLRFYGQG